MIERKYGRSAVDDGKTEDQTRRASFPRICNNPLEILCGGESVSNKLQIAITSTKIML